MNNINRLPPAFLKARLRIINSKLDRIPSIHEGTHNGRPVVRSYKGKIKHEYQEGTAKCHELLGVLEIKNNLIMMKEQLEACLSMSPDVPDIDPSKISSRFDKDFFDRLQPRAEFEPFVSGYKHKEIYMRSRGELIVADVLDSLDLKYIYEPVIEINGKTYYPDFVVYLPEFNRCIFIEFLGRLDDKQYVVDNGFKIGNYLMKGLVINEDLILFCGWENKMVSSDCMVDDIVALITKFCRMYTVSSNSL